jgi:CDGSH-type Zn-finger protein
MSEPKIAKLGPYVLDETPGKKAWCACGHSQKQPFCDGAHKGSGMSPVIVEIKESGKVAWCGCKHSKNPPYCDGSHSKIK